MKYLSLTLSLVSLAISAYLYVNFDQKVNQSLLDGSAIVQSIEYNPETILNAIKTAEAIEKVKDDKTQLIGEISNDKNMQPDLSTGVFLKKSNSKNFIVIYSDFECPVCKNVSPLLKMIKDRDVNLILKAVPLNKHQKGKQAAIQFEKMFLTSPNLNYLALYDLLFTTQDLMLQNPQIYFEKLYSELKLKKLETQEQNALNRLSMYKKEVSSFGINSVPSFNINGNIIQGLPSEEEWSLYIDKFIK